MPELANGRTPSLPTQIDCTATRVVDLLAKRWETPELSEKSKEVTRFVATSFDFQIQQLQQKLA
ncbi:hypothetical protein [Acidicapsa acidisoli]|uniref:hypothetical protein n=1 Tax=Acidicapsa acidisoli TaxID=1615681 RepID=UPI0021E05C85|nr:hypothetical protein [Acidicapsa acidisoli]